MQTEQRATWDRLAVELELLSSEDPTSLIQLLQGLNGLLWPDESMEWAVRTLNFMTYELMAQCEGLTEPERFDRLNDYYFKSKGFQILQLKSSETFDRHLLLKPVLENRAGAPIIIALIYLHFAAHLDLPAYLIQLRNHYLLKWTRSGRTCYVDLCSEGREVSENELMQILSRSVESSTSSEALSILPNRKNFVRYAEDLMRIYERLNLSDKLHSIYNVILKVEPQNSRLIGRRGLLRKKLGLNKDALADLKRYFAFIDRTQAPPEMVQALQELSGASDIFKTSPSDLLH